MHGQPPSDRTALINLYLTNALVLTGFLAYSLSRLVGAARQLEDARNVLARVAGTVERLRLARDVHDLLGLGLSTLALKADLVEQLISRHDPRAAVEIRMMSRICATTRADVWQVAAGRHPPTLEEEVAAASDILSSAGIEIHVTLPTKPLGATIDSVLVPVLRESVTNVLRHSVATSCSIEVDTQVDRVRLAVSNNGVAGESPRPDLDGVRSDTIPGGGQGLLNLRSRVQSAGGEMLTQQLNDNFQLVADVPKGPLSDYVST